MEHQVTQGGPPARPPIGQQIDCLDHGFVRMVDFMGNDAAIVQAARVSYQEGTKTFREDSALINYLLSHEHTTPFEMVVLKFHMKMPIFVARQVVRHRMVSINEVSARYSILKDEFYIPENLRVQDTKNRQGSSGQMEEEKDLEYRGGMEQHNMAAYMFYETMLADNVGREQARMVLPLSVYTEWYWKIDLHNLFRFLKLRLDPHAQWETQQYALAIQSLIKQIVPVAYEAFEEHILHAIKMSRSERQAITKFLTEHPLEGMPQDVAKPSPSSSARTSSGRERQDLRPPQIQLGVPGTVPGRRDPLCVRAGRHGEGAHWVHRCHQRSNVPVVAAPE